MKPHFFSSRMKSLALALCLGWIFIESSVAFELVPHTASYTAKFKKGLKINGSAVRELKQLKDGRWHYRFDVESMVADIDESVIFELKGDRIRPQEYRYKLSGFFIRDRHQEVRFLWDKGVAEGQHKDKDWKIELSPQTYDRLGYQLQLLLDVQSRKPDMSYDVAHKGKLRSSTFAIIREEPIETVLGKVDSIVVEKVRAPEKKRETLLWFSKSAPYLLLKMTQVEDDGEEYEILLKSTDLE